MKYNLKYTIISAILTVFLLSGIVMANGTTGWEQRMMEIYDYVVQRLFEEYPHLNQTTPTTPQKQFHIEDVPFTISEITISPQTPYWQELETITVSPHGNSTRTALYGIKYTINVSVETDTKEFIMRFRIDSPDNTFYTMWLNHKSTTPGEYTIGEKITNIIHDGRWATGEHDMLMMADQPYYNITLEAATFATNSTIHNLDVDILCLSEIE